MKKILSFVLVICLITALVPFSFAVSAEIEEWYFNYEVNNGEAEIYSVYWEISGDVTVPLTLGGYPVTVIGDYAFDGCKFIENLVIHDGIKSIGDGAFADCEALESITVDENNTAYHSDGNCLIETASKTLIAACKNSVIPSDGSVAVIADYAFSGCIDLESVTIPEGITRIGISAFNGCTALESINIPRTVTTIGRFAFSYCDALTDAYFENTQDWYASMTKIYKSELEDSEVAAVLLKDTYDGLDWDYRGSNNIPDNEEEEEGFTYIYEINGGKATVTGVDGVVSGDVIIPDAFENCPVTSIYDSAFSGCTRLTSITIPESVTHIGYNAFGDCYNLTDVYFENTEIWHTPYKIIPSSELSDSKTAAEYLTDTYRIYDWECVESIDYYTYDINGTVAIITEVNGLISGDVTVPAELDGYPVTAIDNYAFYSCTELTGVTVPEGVKYIGERAFYACTNLERVSFSSSVVSIGGEVFSGCQSIAEITVDENNSVYHSDGNCLIETASKTLIAGCKTSVIPADESVTTIGEFAFESCKELESITIPNGVTSVERYAFDSCENLKSVSFSKSVTVIEHGIFSGCKKLESITVDEDNTAYHSDGNCLIETASKTLIAGCKTSVIPSDKSVTVIGECAFDRSGIESVIIPDGVTHIGALAFYYCASLADITLPDSVTYIGDNAFDNTLYFSNEENWENGLLYIDNHLIEAHYTLTGDCVIKDGTKTIAEAAFQYRDEITSVSIPESVTSICENAFADCTGLTSATFENTKGWSIYHWSTGNVKLSPDELEENAADYLASTYSDCAWTRSVAGGAGDLNGDEEVSADDAIYLLYRIFFGDTQYPVSQDCDFDGNGSLEADDAIYLLYRVFFGETMYPLYPNVQSNAWTGNY